MDLLRSFPACGQRAARDAGNFVSDPGRAVPVGEVVGLRIGGSDEPRGAGPFAEWAEALREAVAGLSWDSSGTWADDVRRCLALEDVAMELAAKREHNIKQIAGWLAGEATAIESWEWEEELAGGTSYVIIEGGEDEFDTEVRVSHKSFSHHDEATGARAGLREADIAVGVASVPEMLASWMSDHYDTWQQSRPGHLDADCTRWAIQDVDAFRAEAHRRWEQGDLSRPKEWAHWDHSRLHQTR